ncbi:hypothetical protein Amet_3119 [Alkaliphilus metalliredigens QYMF]|uniref:Uncharacterized protein n=1 Tax=Alkaliphilus metalliredigens (strain QYMF) TaxID=293826 RepID=A6TSU0_ALKMQ|nr:hypothetical protein [Alkaliphilus metalliredigens]ABR49258.1 hypothetical protein Amet_3119 [Alkaliphilus metalliredigens QYMF]
MSEKERKFKRGFEGFDLSMFIGEEIYQYIKKDIDHGEIFPALRDNRIDFYYEGGCIFQYKNNRFSYNPAYLKYNEEKYKPQNSKNSIFKNHNFDLKTFYEDLKQGVKNRFTTKNNKETERQFLSRLYKSTHSCKESNTVVLDIEIRFNKVDGKKCDLMLYNNQKKKLMLVEAKVVGNKYLVSKTTPKVIDQVREYSSWINEGAETFTKQYSYYIEFMNSVFDKNLNNDIKDICKSAKLIIFETEKKTIIDKHKQKLQVGLGKGNVWFVSKDKSQENIDIDTIWKMLDK